MRSAVLLTPLVVVVAACSIQYVPIRAPEPIPPGSRPVPIPGGGQQYDPTQLAQWLPAPWSTNNGSQIACYTKSNVSIQQSDLLLRITRQPCDGLPESGAWLQSPTMWRYGKFEARIYLPASAHDKIANWPAFWLEDPNEWPVNGEIDVMEGLNGGDYQDVHYGFHVKQKLTVRASPHYALVSPGWYTFAVDWTSTSVHWYIDGRLTGLVRSHVPQHRMQIVLDYTAWRSAANNLAPATMLVAWVRVYAPPLGTER